jgi:hypothetical protein
VGNDAEGDTTDGGKLISFSSLNSRKGSDLTSPSIENRCKGKTYYSNTGKGGQIASFGTKSQKTRHKEDIKTCARPPLWSRLQSVTVLAPHMAPLHQP